MMQFCGFLTLRFKYPQKLQVNLKKPHSFGVRKDHKLFKVEEAHTTKKQDSYTTLLFTIFIQLCAIVLPIDP